MRVCLCLLSLLLLSTPCHAAGLEETFAQAQAAFKAGNFAQAGELFAAAGDQLHKSGDASKAGLLWGNAAVAHIKGENWAAAADLYEKILAANKRLPQDQALRVYKNLVLCRAKLNQRALQVTAIDRMLKAVPKLPPAELADVYARQGDAYRIMELYGPAAAAYDKAAHLLPASAPAAQRARIFTAMGLCQGNLGDYGKATQSLEQARKLAASVNETQTTAESDSNLGILYLERGDYPKAMELLKNALAAEEKAKLRRSEGIDHNNLGLVCKAVGSHQEAMRHVEQSLAIAREVGNVRDEAIAMVNRALIHRIAGKLNEARADYREAVKLFEQCGFQEGMAGALLGIGRMEALADKNYALALENYQKALDIYTKLSLPRGRAETLLQLGEVYKYTAAPGRTTRDLVFDDEPTLPQVEPGKAIEQSRAYFAQAIEIAQQLQSKEMIWSAHQGLGYADFREGKLEDALKHYTAAIDTVTSMYTSLESVELLGEYMAGKEDLFSEAQEVCAALYEKTKDKKYLDLQMKYSETLRNEVQKASAALVQMQFEDKNKQAMYEKLNALGRQQAKAAKAIPISKMLAKDATPEQKAEKSLSDKAIKEQTAVAQKLEGDYKKLLAEWEKKYPEDKLLFESSSKVDIKMIQKNIGDNNVALQYITMPEKIIIISIDKINVNVISVPVSKKELDRLIKTDLLVNYIEMIGRDGDLDLKTLKKGCAILKKLHSILINPVNNYISGKKRIYIISNGFLAQVPFGAFVTSNEEDQLQFLVEKYEIGYLRPTFISSINNSVPSGKVKKMLAIANPVNANFFMSPLPGTVDEIKLAYEQLRIANLSKTIGIDITLGKDAHSNVTITPMVMKKYLSDPKEQETLSENNITASFPGISFPPEKPTEQWLREKLSAEKFEIFYIATHGMPYSNVFVSLKDQRKKGEKANPVMLKSIRLVDNNLKTRSPLNGFLYLSSEKGDDILKNEIPPSRDGLLTMKEITELPKELFNDTKYIILSACNTGVTLVPNAIREGTEEESFNPSDTEKDLQSQGWVPGVDQASFVETFMRKGVNNVYGTFWQADDNVSSILMGTFIKNLIAQGSSPDAITAYTNAQRQYISDAKNGKIHVKGVASPIHPYLWAVGAIFGK